jgi:hypothetical protein
MDKRDYTFFHENFERKPLTPIIPLIFQSTDILIRSKSQNSYARPLPSAVPFKMVINNYLLTLSVFHRIIFPFKLRSEPGGNAPAPVIRVAH